MRVRRSIAPITFASVVFARCSPVLVSARIAVIAQNFESIVIMKNTSICPNRSLDEATNPLAIGSQLARGSARAGRYERENEEHSLRQWVFGASPRPRLHRMSQLGAAILTR